MPGSYSRLVAHATFSTCYRIPFITDEREEELFAYLGAGISAEGGKPVVCGGYRDHVHLLFFYRPAMRLSDLVRDVKKASTDWMRRRFDLPKFAWQGGGGYFSVDHYRIDEVARYIRRQRAHHQKTTFAEEYRSLMEEHGVEYDERYLLEEEGGPDPTLSGS
jgi:REP element-mobilizing transposase RayT